MTMLVTNNERPLFGDNLPRSPIDFTSQPGLANRATTAQATTRDPSVTRLGFILLLTSQSLEKIFMIHKSKPLLIITLSFCSTLLLLGWLWGQAATTVAPILNQTKHICLSNTNFLEGKTS